MVRILGFPFVRGGGKCFDPSSVWKKHVYKEQEPSELLWGREANISTAPWKASTKRKQKHIGGANTKYWGGEICRKRGEEQHLGRMERSKQSRQRKKRNNKKLFGKHAFISSNLQQQRSGEQERGTEMMTRIFSWGVPLFLLGYYFFVGVPILYSGYQFFSWVPILCSGLDQNEDKGVQWRNTNSLLGYRSRRKGGGGQREFNYVSHFTFRRPAPSTNNTTSTSVQDRYRPKQIEKVYSLQ